LIPTLLAIQRFAADCLNTVLSMGKIVLLSRRPSALPAPSRRACSLLGNGPSLKETLAEDSQFLTETELFCVNNFAGTAEYSRLRPQNYVLHDPAYYLYDGVTFDRADIASTLKALREQTSWPLNVYVQQRAKKSAYLQALAQGNPHIRLVYYNYTIFYGFDWLKHWLFKQKWAMPQAQNVLVVALYLAINRRFERVYLFGADHSWHEQFRLGEDNLLELKHEHFYSTPDNKHIPIIDVNDPARVTMSMQFASLSKAFAGYEILKKFADYQKVTVLNASKKTYIDAFVRVKI
jgi:hypothetical protein